jgi:PAS domain S-box-containing protein
VDAALNWLALHLRLVAGICGSVGVIVVSVVKVWPKIKKFWQRVVAFIDAIEELPEMRQAQLVATEELAGLSTLARRVNAALLSDAPDSVPGKLTQLFDQGAARTQQMTEHGEHISRLDKKIDSVANTQRAVINTNPRMGVFEADHFGRYVDANRAYLRWTGLTIQEIVGWGWINAVLPVDRGRVRDEWLSSVKDVRRFELRFHLVHTGGRVIEVDCSADPIPPGANPCERWHGTMYEVAGVSHD